MRRQWKNRLPDAVFMFILHTYDAVVYADNVYSLKIIRIICDSFAYKEKTRTMNQQNFCENLVNNFHFVKKNKRNAWPDARPIPLIERDSNVLHPSIGNLLQDITFALYSYPAAYNVHCLSASC